MRSVVWGVLGLVGCCAGACSAPSDQGGGGGGRNLELSGDYAGQGEEGVPLGAEGGRAGVLGLVEPGDMESAGAGGLVDAAGGAAGSATSDTSGMPAGGVVDAAAGAAGSATSGTGGMPAPPRPTLPFGIWSCLNPAGDGWLPEPSRAGASGANAVEEIGPPMTLPAGSEATLAQLVGVWFTRDKVGVDPYGFWGLDDAFEFKADGTGSQMTYTWTDRGDESDTTYAGPVELTGHVITIDSIAGTRSFSSSSLYPGYEKPRSDELPHQLVHFGYSYDSLTDTLYINTDACLTPLAFKRE